MVLPDSRYNGVDACFRHLTKRLKNRLVSHVKKPSRN
jgi:hypothetical protein